MSSVTGITFAKTADFSTASPGQPILFSFDIGTSAMTETATNVTITETVPAGCTFNDSEDLWVPQGDGRYVYTVGFDIEKDATQPADFFVPDFMVLVNEDTTLTSITNTAVLADTEGDSISAATTVSIVAPEQIFGLSKSDGLTEVSAGQTVTYAIQYSTTQAVTGVALTEILPEDTTYVGSSQDGTWTQVVDGVYQLDLGDLAADDSGTAYFTVQVAASPSGGSILNQVTISDASGNTLTASDEDTIGGATASFTISKSDGVDTVAPGDTLTYTITYQNTGAADATGYYLTETLPAGLLFSSSGNTGWTQSGTTLTYNNVGTVTAGSTGTATLVLTVANPAAAGNTIDNTVTITDGTSSATSPADTDTLNAAPAFVISKSDGVTTAQPGDVLTYAISYTNSSSLGNQNATGVTLTETVPTGATFNSAGSTTGWVETTAGSGIYVYPVGALASGATGSVNFAVTVNSKQAAGQDTIVNSVLIADDSGVSATANETDTLVAAPDMAVTKTDNLTQVGAGQTITYTVGYSNVGDQGATGVVLTDTLPANLSFSSANNTGWSQSGSTLTYNVGAVAAGATGSVALKLTVASSAAVGDHVINTVTIADDGTNGADTGSGNNTATDDDTVGGVDLAIAKVVSSTTAIAGQALTYTITVSNVGAGAAPNVVVTDVLPTGTTFVSATAPSGFTVSAPTAGTSGTVTFSASTLAGGASATLTLIVQTNPNVSAVTTTLSNTATVASSVNDMNSANNTATSATTQVKMVGVGLRTSSVDPTKNDLIIGGSPNRDVIMVTPKSASTVTVYMNGSYYGPYSVTGRVVVYARGGADYVTVTTTCTLPALISGGDGNDVVYAGGGPTVILGGAGNDTLVGSRADCILIGGTGSDTLRASTGETILIGGSSSYDAREYALTALLNEWSRSDIPYWKRVRHVYDGGAGISPVGLNGTYYFNRNTLIDDGYRDYLIGGPAMDFFFTHNSGGGTYDLTSGLVNNVEWLRQY